MGRKKTADEVILSKLQRPDKVSITSIDTFDTYFEKERTINRKGNISKKGRLLIKTTGYLEEYESGLEKKILSLLDGDDHIISIKTQSVCLEYYYWGKDRYYFPDIVFLSANGHIGIIEVKDTISMFKAKTNKKYEALQQYCIQNGFFYAMLNDRDDVETLRNASINEELEGYLLRLFEVRKSITWASIKDTCKENGWIIQDVLTIAYNNNWKIQSPKSRVWAFSIKK